MHDDDFKDINLTPALNSQASDSNLSLHHKSARRKSPSLKKKIGICLGVVIILLVGSVGAGWWLLTPADNQPVMLTIKSGASTSQVIDQLVEKGALRNAQIAKLYLKITKFNPNFTPGDYQIAPHQPNIKILLLNLKKTKPDTQRITIRGRLLIITTAKRIKHHRTAKFLNKPAITTSKSTQPLNLASINYFDCCRR